MSDIESVEHNLAPEVPSHWRVVPLGDVLVDIVGGGTPSKANASYWAGDIPWLTVKDMRSRRPTDAIDHISATAIEESSTNKIPANTVIIATRIGLGKVVRVPFEAAINQDLKALIAIPEVDKGYLEYWIVSIASYLESIGSGTTVKGIRLEQVRSLPFPFAPVNEQARIVAEIEKQFSRLDEAVANLKRVKANLKRYKAAVLKAAVEGKLTEEWRRQHPEVEPADKLLERILAERRKAAGKGKYKEPVGTETSGLPELPAGWVWVSWDVILRAEKGSFRRGPFGGSLKKSIFIPSSDHKVYEQYCPINDDPKFARYFITKEKYEEMKSFAVAAGDFLISCSGSLGRITQIPLDYDPGVINQALLRVRIDKALMSDEYFLRLFRSPYFQKQIIDNTQGAAMVNVKGVDDLKAIPIPLPPLAEQTVIVEILEQTLSLAIQVENQIDIDLRRADRLRQSILKQAFSGQLVPQDPNDEPASVLLERIRQRVGAIHESPARATRKPKRGIHESPLRKPKQTAEPKSAASADFACLDDVTAAILARMQPGREYARADLADALGLTTGRWNAAIQELKRIGKVRQVGEKRGARYVLSGRALP